MPVTTRNAALDTDAWADLVTLFGILPDSRWRLESVGPAGIEVVETVDRTPPPLVLRGVVLSPATPRRHANSLLWTRHDKRFLWGKADGVSGRETVLVGMPDEADVVEGRYFNEDGPVRNPGVYVAVRDDGDFTAADFLVHDDENTALVPAFSGGKRLGFAANFYINGLADFDTPAIDQLPSFDRLDDEKFERDGSPWYVWSSKVVFAEVWAGRRIVLTPASRPWYRRMFGGTG